MDYNKIFEAQLNTLKREGNYRVFAPLERLCGQFPKALYTAPDGTTKQVTLWCSNDYLGMGQNKIVLNAMKDAIDHYGAGAGGTRNISGTQKLHVDLENSLAALHQKESALLFSSGYVANEGALGTLIKLLGNPIVFSDALNHASMIHGMRSAPCDKKIYRHNDVAHLQELLEGADKTRPKIIAFESVYSMEGDIAPIAEICALAKKHNALTYLDEVHAVGLYGATGGGVAQKEGLLDQVDILEGTFGKAYGVMGGFITANATLIDAIRSFSAPFIFTTALPPAVLAGSLASVEYLKTSTLERACAHSNAKYLKQKLAQANLPFMDGDSHIVPLVVGEAKCCKGVTDILLKDHNIYVQPINYPTVPVGTERMRLTATAAHKKEDIDALVNILSNLYTEHRVLERLVG